MTPSDDHKKVHGGTTRHALAVAALEVEALLKGAYLANTPSAAAAPKTTIKDFFKLKGPMRLGDWGVRLRYYPEWGDVFPFRDWTGAAAPDWWTANNDLKHRPDNFQRANLESAINAALAVRVLVTAEFGPRADEMLVPGGISSAEIVVSPNWTPQERYFPSTKNHVDGAFRPRRLF